MLTRYESDSPRAHDAAQEAEARDTARHLLPPLNERKMPESVLGQDRVAASRDNENVHYLEFSDPFKDTLKFPRPDAPVILSPAESRDEAPTEASSVIPRADAPTVFPTAVRNTDAAITQFVGTDGTLQTSASSRAPSDLSSPPLDSRVQTDTLTNDVQPPAVQSGGKWTYLVQLGATIGGDGGGAPALNQQLKDLRPLTIGNDSEVIVQSALPDGNVGTYVIKDGVTTIEAPTKSQGLAGDLQNLVSMAPSTGQVALIENVHGGAQNGMAGDNGDASLQEIHAAITNGLQASGRTHLDALSFDSCVMSNAETLQQFAPIANYIVASETDENVVMNQNANGQNVFDAMSNLLKQPPSTGNDVANQLIWQSQGQCAGQSIICGTDNLASFDSSQGAKFSDAFNNFASSLDSAVKDSPKNAAGIESAIGNSPETSGGSFQLRDLKTFAQNVVQGIQDGSISDPKGDLQNAANTLINAQQNMTNETFSKTGDLNGVNVFLPSQDHMTPEDLAQNNVDSLTQKLGALGQQWADIAKQMSGDSPPSQAQLVNTVTNQLTDVMPQIQSLISSGGQGTEGLSQITLGSLILHMKPTWSAADFAAMAGLANGASVQLATNRDALIEANVPEATKELTALYDTQATDSPTLSKWDHFIQDIVVQTNNNDLPTSPPSAQVSAPGEWAPIETSELPTKLPDDTTAVPTEAPSNPGSQGAEQGNSNNGAPDFSTVGSDPKGSAGSLDFGAGPGSAGSFDFGAGSDPSGSAGSLDFGAGSDPSGSAGSFDFGGGYSGGSSGLGGDGYGGGGYGGGGGGSSDGAGYGGGGFGGGGSSFDYETGC